MKIRIHFLGETVANREYGRPVFNKHYARVETYSTVKEVPIQYRHNIHYMLQENTPALHTGDIVYTITEDLS